MIMPGGERGFVSLVELRAAGTTTLSLTMAADASCLIGFSIVVHQDRLLF